MGDIAHRTLRSECFRTTLKMFYAHAIPKLIVPDTANEEDIERLLRNVGPRLIKEAARKSTDEASEMALTDKGINKEKVEQCIRRIPGCPHLPERLMNGLMTPTNGEHLQGIAFSLPEGGALATMFPSPLSPTTSETQLRQFQDSLRCRGHEPRIYPTERQETSRSS